MKIRSYKREFLDKVKEKFNDVQPGNKNIANDLRKSCDDKERSKCNTARMVVRK